MLVELQRLSQMLLGELVAASEEARHLVVPASQRAIRGSLLKRRVKAQHGQERVLDRFAIFDALAEPKRFGERPHVCRQPEIPRRAIGLQGNRLAARVDAFFVLFASLGLRRVATEPVIGTRELPRRVERAGAAGGELLAPPVRGAPRTREVGAVGVQPVGFGGRRVARTLCRLGRQSGDIE